MNVLMALSIPNSQEFQVSFYSFEDWSVSPMLLPGRSDARSKLGVAST